MVTFRNGKLARGSYFYITMGDLYLKGLVPEIIERELKPEKSSYSWRDHYEMRNRFISVKKRKNITFERLRNQPKKTVREQTGRTLYEWTDKLDEAKQFRSRAKADETCKILKLHLADMDAVPQVHLHERKVA